MMISIIMAAYNAAETISDSILSVLRQTKSEWQLIIVDDGSTDNTSEVIMNFQDRRIKYFFKTNEGVSIARNYGVLQAEGDYILFLDADDELFENAVEDFVKMAKDNSNIGILCGTYIHSPNIEVPPRIKGKIHQDYMLNTLVGSYMLSKRIFTTIGGFDENLRYSENWELFIRLTKYCRDNRLTVISSDFLTFKYNFDESHAKNLLRKDRIIKSYIYLFEKYKNINGSSIKYAFSFAETIAFNYFKLGERKKSLQWQKIAISNEYSNLKAYLKFVRYLITNLHTNEEHSRN